MKKKALVFSHLLHDQAIVILLRSDTNITAHNCTRQIGIFDARRMGI